MKQIPSTVVICVLLLVIASWPSMQTWADEGAIHHFLGHALYLLAGALFGLQTAWWTHRSESVQAVDEGSVSS